MFKENNKEIYDCMNNGYSLFVLNDRRVYEDKFNLKWISYKILPVLEELGCTQFSAKDILEIFTQHDKERSIFIHV